MQVWEADSPLEARMTQLHISGILEKALGSRNGIHVFASAQASQSRPSPPLFWVQFVQYGELP